MFLFEKFEGQKYFFIRLYQKTFLFWFGVSVAETHFRILGYVEL